MAGNPYPNSLPPGLEQKLGAQIMNKRQDAELNDLMQCPPVPPQLIAHLRLKFSDPGAEAKPTNPLLAQLLTIQYGCEKVLLYLEKHYEMQSAQARREREI